MTINQLAKSKTLWAGLATMATGVGLYFSGEQTLESLVITIAGVVFTVLRFYTDRPLGNK